MSVTPLRNPIAAAPLGSSNPAAVDQRVEEQRTALNPESIGENLNAQEIARQSATEAAQLVSQNQTNQQVAGLQQQIEQMRSDMAAQAAAPAASAPAPPPRDFSLTDEELAEMGTHLPGAIDKRAQAASTAAITEAVRQATEQSSGQIAALQAEIDALKGTVTQTTSTQANQFEATALAAATQNGLNTQTLGGEADWQAFINEKADMVSGTTFGQYYDHAFKTYDAKTISTLFSTFAQRRAAAQAAAPTAAPSPAGGAARTQTAPAGQNDTAAELAQIQTERDDLVNRRQRRIISGQEYDVENNKLAARLNQLQASLPTA